jgi:hypothetical protein
VSQTLEPASKDFDTDMALVRFSAPFKIERADNLITESISLARDYWYIYFIDIDDSERALSSEEKSTLGTFI